MAPSRTRNPSDEDPSTRSERPPRRPEHPDEPVGEFGDDRQSDEGGDSDTSAS